MRRAEIFPVLKLPAGRFLKQDRTCLPGVLEDGCFRDGYRRPTSPEEMVKYDKVTVHFTGDREPMVVEQVTELAKSHFPGSGKPALQIIDAPLEPTGGGLFDLELNLADPSEIDHLVLQEGEEKRVARLEEVFPQWDW